MTFPISISDFDFQLRFPTSISKSRFRCDICRMHMTFTENSNTNFDASNPTAFDTCRELQGQQNTRRYFRDFGDSVSGFGGDTFDASNPTAFDTCRELQGRQNTRRYFRDFGDNSGFEYAVDVIFDRSIIK
jgi:hypothetical protein